MIRKGLESVKAGPFNVCCYFVRSFGIDLVWEGIT